MNEKLHWKRIYTAQTCFSIRTSTEIHFYKQGLYVNETYCMVYYLILTKYVIQFVGIQLRIFAILNNIVKHSH